MKNSEEFVDVIISAILFDNLTQLVQLVSRQKAAKVSDQPALVVPSAFYFDAHSVADEKPLNVEVKIYQSYEKPVYMEYKLVVAGFLRTAY
jgi:hypothetical protein